MILETLNTEEKELLEYRKLNKDEIVFHENEICNYVGFIIEGSLSIVSFLNDGKKIIYNQPKQNEMFGNNLIFSSEPYYKGDIIADNHCEIALLNKSNLITLLQNNKAFMIEYMSIQSNFTKQLNNTIKLLSINSAKERFLYYLHTNKNKITYQSITSLAANISIERETLSRLLTKLEKNNIIIRNNKTIILNKEKR